MRAGGGSGADADAGTGSGGGSGGSAVIAWLDACRAEGSIDGGSAVNLGALVLCPVPDCAWSWQPVSLPDATRHMAGHLLADGIVQPPDFDARFTSMRELYCMP